MHLLLRIYWSRYFFSRFLFGLTRFLLEDGDWQGGERGVEDGGVRGGGADRERSVWSCDSRSAQGGEEEVEFRKNLFGLEFVSLSNFLHFLRFFSEFFFPSLCYLCGIWKTPAKTFERELDRFPRCYT